jgi:hypothetical protein
MRDIVVDADADIVDAVKSLLPNRRFEAPSAGSPATISVSAREDGWRIDCPRFGPGDRLFTNLYEAANEIAGCIYLLACTQDRRTFGLHAAGVVLEGSGTVLIGDNFAGKSTLALALTARGARFVDDDRSVVDWRSGDPHLVSLGGSAKLRLPMPTSAPRWFVDFLDRTTRLTWPEVAVVQPPHEQALAAGDGVPLTGIYLLDRRREAGAPALETVGPAAAMTGLLNEIVAPHLNAAESLDLARRIAGKVPVWRLSYADSFEAAIMLTEQRDDGVRS